MYLKIVFIIANSTDPNVMVPYVPNATFYLGLHMFASIQAPRLFFFSCSTQLSKKFQLLIKAKILTNKEVSCFKSLRCCIYHANVKMPTIVGILTLMSRINFLLS